MVVTSLHLLSGGRADASRSAPDTARRLWKDVSASAATNRRASSRCWSPRGRRPTRIRSSPCGPSAPTDGRAHLGGRSVPVGVLGQVTTSIPDHPRAERPTAAAAARRAAWSPGPVRRCRRGRGAGDYRAKRARWIELSDELAQRRASSYELAQEADRLRFAVQELMRSTRRQGGRRTRRDHQAPDRPGDRARGRGAGTRPRRR